MHIGDRKEREEYMDSLERQMEDQREQIRRTLDRMGGSGRRRTVLERLRTDLPKLPGRIPARGTGEDGQDGPRPPESPGPTPTPPEVDEGPQRVTEPSEQRRGSWRRIFGAWGRGTSMARERGRLGRRSRGVGDGGEGCPEERREG